MLIQPVLRPVLQPVLRSIFDPGIGGGGTPIWSPAALFAGGEQGGWYDPSDLSTMFQDAAGTIPVTAVGQPVGRINDKSGRGNSSTQSTAASRPLLQQDGSGNYYLDFDGVDDFFSTSSFNMASTAVSAVCGTYRRSSGTANLLSFSTTNETDNNSFILWSCRAITAGDMGMAGLVSSIATAIATAQPINVPLISTALWNTLAPSLSLYVNQSLIASSSSSMGAGSFGTKPLYIGRQAGGNFLKGRVYSVVLVGRALSAGELGSTEAYVNTKTGAY